MNKYTVALKTKPRVDTIVLTHRHIAAQSPTLNRFKGTRDLSRQLPPLPFNGDRANVGWRSGYSRVFHVQTSPGPLLPNSATMSLTTHPSAKFGSNQFSEETFERATVVRIGIL